MVADRALGEFLACVEDRYPFAISRWGDHEWATLNREKIGQIPADGHYYFNSLYESLGAVLHSQPVYLLANASSPACKKQAAHFIHTHGYSNLNWTDGDLQASDDEFDTIVQAVSAKPLIVVGPPKLRHARKVLRWSKFIDVPPKNAYLCRREIVGSVLAALEKFNRPVTVTLSAGVTTPLLVDDLYAHAGQRHQLIDVGSLWDRLCQPMPLGSSNWKKLSNGS